MRSRGEEGAGVADVARGLALDRGEDRLQRRARIVGRTDVSPETGETGFGSRRAPTRSSFQVGAWGHAMAMSRTAFIADPASRLANRVQLTTDGHKAHLYAGEAPEAFEARYPNLADSALLAWSTR